MNEESGFTLIELLTVLAIIGVLSSLGVTAFRVYQANAAYVAASETLRQARTSFEAGINDIDNPPASVGLTLQTSSGQLDSAQARDLLVGLKLPKSVAFQVAYDSGCLAANCQSAFMQVRHCQGEQFVRWVRFGDGSSILLENLAGEGC